MAVGRRCFSYPLPIPPHPDRCLCHANLQKMFVFSLAPPGKGPSSMAPHGTAPPRQRGVANAPHICRGMLTQATRQ